MVSSTRVFVMHIIVNLAYVFFPSLIKNSGEQEF